MPLPLSENDRDSLEVRKVQALERLADGVELLAVLQQQAMTVQLAGLPTGRTEELNKVLERITKDFEKRRRL
jgi:hypothetical protein